MRQAAAPHARVWWVAGRAEAIPCRARSFDLVVCAQSFHWLDVSRALPEFARVLRNGRRLLDLLRALHHRHADAAGFVTLVYETEIYISARL